MEYMNKSDSNNHAQQIISGNKISQNSNALQFNQFFVDIQYINKEQNTVNVCSRAGETVLHYFTGRQNYIVLRSIEYELLKAILKPYHKLYPHILFYSRINGKQTLMF